MHVASQKHLKNVLRNKESSARTSSPDLPSTAYDDMPQSSSASEDMSNACKLYRLQNTINPQNNVFFCLVLQPDGVYNCKVCVEFSCSGPIPMEAHLNDKPHLDNLMRSNLKKLPLEQLTISSPTLPPQPEIQLIPTIVEKRVEKVWNHPTICGYTYDDSFSQLTTDEKIEILSPHFAFLGKEDPIPNLVKYFSM